MTVERKKFATKEEAKLSKQEVRRLLDSYKTANVYEKIRILNQIRTHTLVIHD